MRAGTSPGITTLLGGSYEVAYQDNTGSVATLGADHHGSWGLGMAAGTSPALTALDNGSYEVGLAGVFGNP